MELITKFYMCFVFFSFRKNCTYKKKKNQINFSFKYFSANQNFVYPFSHTTCFFVFGANQKLTPKNVSVSTIYIKQYKESNRTFIIASIHLFMIFFVHVTFNVLFHAPIFIFFPLFFYTKQ